eukprot:jgi/Tetstr1/433843/TSEL_023028.t2
MAGRPPTTAALLLWTCTIAAAALLQNPDVAAASGPLPPPRLSRPLWWHAPFFSGGGYASEAASFAAALRGAPLRLWVSQHGDAFSPSVLSDMLPEERDALLELAQAAPQPRRAPPSVVVCHSEPGAWAVPRPLFSTSECPPAPSGQHYVIGRTMFETDRLTAEHVQRCNRMDEVWVPSAFNRDTFAAAGVERHRLRVVPQGVDTRVFDPARHAPMALPVGERVWGRPSDDRGSAFVFLSVFKWEERKAWSVLLRAFLEEFRDSEAVALQLLTKPYHSSTDFAGQMRAWAAEQPGLPVMEDAPAVYVETRHVPQRDLPALYAGADAFVLPSRGEGWGRPHMEAMAMGCPVIATNWSGPTAFLSERVGYPLPIEGLVPILDGPFAGHRWAEPSVPALRAIMRRLYDDPAEAAAKGRLARQHIAVNFSLDVMRDIVLAELRRIEAQLAGGRTDKEEL